MPGCTGYVTGIILIQVLHKITISVRIETPVVNIKCGWAIPVFADSINLEVLPATEVVGLVRMINYIVFTQTRMAATCIL
jgi:hypothetical protein